MSLHRVFVARCCAVAVAGLLGAASSFAHITLEQGTADAGGSYKAVFRVGHGCGKAPTTGITVFMPAGVTNAHPMPKAGWGLESSESAVQGTKTTQVSWHGGTLLSEHYDEFTMRLQLPKQPGPLWFRVLQQCDAGASIDWAEVPSQGTSTQGLKRPAALLEVNEASQSAHQHLHH